MRPVLLRLLLIRLLLAAVFLHTALGVPLHAVEHLQEVLAQQLEGDADGHDTVHGGCTWCGHHAQQAPPATPPTWRAPLTPAVLATPWRTADGAAQAEHWPFRARDPPQG